MCLNLEIFPELLKFSTQDVGFFWDGGGRKAQQVGRCFSQLICLGWGRGGEEFSRSGGWGWGEWEGGSSGHEEPVRVCVRVCVFC